MAVDRGWKRLGAEIARTRSHRWPLRRDFADECQVSVRVLAALENAERTNFSRKTLGLVEVALGWEPGSMDDVRRGAPPRVRQSPEVTRLLDLVSRMSEDAVRMLVAIAERAVDQ